MVTAEPAVRWPDRVDADRLEGLLEELSVPTGAVRGCFSSAGQLCLSFERCYVHADVVDDFVGAFAERAAGRALAVGVPVRRTRGTRVGTADPVVAEGCPSSCCENALEVHHHPTSGGIRAGDGRRLTGGPLYGAT